MPTDKAGRFHNNIQRAMASDKMHIGIPAKESRGARAIEKQSEPGASESGGHSIHDNGDGTFHSMSAEGERTEHPTAGHAAAHFLGKHGEEGKHAVSSHDGFSHTSHQVETGGEVQGPHDHESTESLGEHLRQFFDEEANEGGSPSHGMPTGRMKDVY